jgi:thymidine kinase
MSLELITGPMFSGKSSEIIRRVNRLKVLGKTPLIITSHLDTRFSENACISTHNPESERICALSFKNISQVFGYVIFKNAEYVIIEEGQFFPDLVEAVICMVETHGKKVIVSGLNGDSDRKPFKNMADLEPYADSVMRLSALCKRCGDGTPGLFSALIKGEKTGQICVGASDLYEAMCRKHYLSRETN